MSNKFARLIALLMALSLIAAACGSSSDGDSASDSDADTASYTMYVDKIGSGRCTVLRCT